MKRLVEQSGLIFVEALDADTHGSVTETSERIYVIAREPREESGIRNENICATQKSYAVKSAAWEMAGACRKVSLRNGGAMGDYMVRATAANAQVRAFAVTTKELVETARQAHNTSPVVTAALGRLLTAA